MIVVRRAWLIAVIVCACSGPEQDASTVDLEDVPSAHKWAVCTYLTRCGSFRDTFDCYRAALGAQVGDVLEFLPPRDYVIVADGVRAGTVSYDGTMMRRCLDAIASFTCDVTDASGRRLPVECLAITHGTVAAGGGCALHAECISQLCMYESNGTETLNCDSNGCCRGTCVGDWPPPLELAVGQPCYDLVGEPSCVEGSYCNGTCMPLRAEGEPCSVSQNGCAYGLGCAGPPHGPYRCMRLPGAGELCGNASCHDEGLSCLNLGEPGRCLPLALEGERCVGEPYVTCSPFYPCDYAAGTCVRGPLAVAEPENDSLCF